MKHKSFWLRMVPVVILVAATVVLSVNIYYRMIHTEEEVCWQRLETATDSTCQKIETRIRDNMNFLTTVSDAYVLTHNMADPKAVGEYLGRVGENTIFQRIDVILPDERLITQDGEITRSGIDIGFEELVAKGIHVTQRDTSGFTGEDVFFCVAPIEERGTVLGVLVGTISCDSLSEIFEVFTYRDSAQLFLIDRVNGKYLMDNWHDTLGNVYENGLRQSIDGEDSVDFAPIVRNGERRRVAYISQTNGERTYQFCAPVEGFSWEVFVAVQEDVVFANVKAMERELLKIGAMELVVVLVYVLWNVCMNIMAARSEERVRLLEYERVKNETRAAFLSSISHDIKTPLNGIVGMLQVIQNHRSEDTVVDGCLEKIQISARYLSTLTSDMLDIREVESNKQILLEEPVDLCRLAEELHAMMERQAEEAGVTCSVDCSQLCQSQILGSSLHIKRILVNLTGNAIKYSAHAGKQVWVTLWDEEAENLPGKRMYCFQVRDNGIGMSQEFQKKMYQAFEQEAIDARSEYQGYGLGLTIVSQLIHKMGGTIALESARGQGSTFTVSIPFPVDRQEQAQPEEVPEDLSGLRLLLAEDNAFNMEIARILLTDAGAAVDTAENGKIAAEMFAASRVHTYDAVVMDMRMPEMDGCQATRMIRQMDRPDAGSVPILAMTANTFSEDVSRCLEAGMNAHVPKPIDIRQLVAVLREHCRPV